MADEGVGIWREEEKDEVGRRMMGERGGERERQRKKRVGRETRQNPTHATITQNLRRRGQVMHARARRDGGIHSSEASSE
jgi:hypothetical protein